VNRQLHALLLIFAFLFAQGGLVAHAATHTAPITHDSGKGVPPDVQCELCVGYAQLAGAAPMPATPLTLDRTARGSIPESAIAVFPTRTIFHTRSRAPPVFS
jgi:hypothetical protein